jgi:predicted DNA-binding protein with PD1-like motif
MIGKGEKTMPDMISGNLGEIILARFKPNEDLYLGLQEVAREYNIRTGVIMTITGGLTVANIGYMDRSGPMEEIMMESHVHHGPFEASGHGMIGVDEDGEPYVHVHITLTCGDLTVCGHLHEGCLVRSLLPTSHFTVFIVKVEGAELQLVWDMECRETLPEVYPNGAPVHVLKSIKS